jgi:hypothetical protein
MFPRAAISRLAAVVTVVVVTGCASVPSAPPPIPAGPGEVLHTGLMVYDTAEPNHPLGGVNAHAALRLGQAITVGGAAQLTLGSQLRPRFLGGSMMARLSFPMGEGLVLSTELIGEYLDAFTYVSGRREPTVLLSLGAPVTWQPMPDVWFWVRPALGGGAHARFYGSTGGLASSGVFPIFRLGYGASWDVGFLQVFGESTTTLPFGGAYLGIGVAVPI